MKKSINLKGPRLSKEKEQKTTKCEWENDIVLAHAIKAHEKTLKINDTPILKVMWTNL
jgi:hypothetical protein